MMSDTEKKQRLFLILGSFFLANALIAEFIGVKIFSVEKTLDWQHEEWTFVGIPLALNMTAGVLLWPIVFIMTDIINEYYGRKGVRLFSFIAAAMVAYAFLAVYLAMSVVPADFWTIHKTESGDLDMNAAFNAVFGQGLWIIIGSLTAFLVGQMVDVYVFHSIKRKSGEKMIWLRATGSTLVSQIFDSFIVLFIAFYLGKIGSPDQWSLKLVLAICLVNYLYKSGMALLLTPLLYVVHLLIDRYLGHELALKMRREAAGDEA